MERGKVLAGSLQLLDGSRSRDSNFSEVMLISNSIDHGVNPFRNWATVTDCGDISNTPFDKLVAIRELEHGMKSINSLKPKNVSSADAVRLITIGGDHTISNYETRYSISNPNGTMQLYRFLEPSIQPGEGWRSSILTATSILGIRNNLVAV
jgi:Arginase family